MKKTIKNKWLKALRSGKYTQGYTQLINYDDQGNEISHCCLGVLGVVCDIPIGDNGMSFRNKDGDIIGYPPALEGLLTEEQINELYQMNDDSAFDEEYSGKYENVIPLIEQL